jgi:hypothetical protein
VITETDEPQIRGVQDIFCDESGFTGNNLFDPEQPRFVYASVAVDPATAGAAVDSVRRQFGLGAMELKGSRLIKFNQGRKAISTILEMHENKIKFVSHEKKYALACKFFEYIFEPLLAAKNSIFYETNFHRYISNLVYMHLMARAEYAEQHLREFQGLMRLENGNQPIHLFGTLDLPKMSPALSLIRDFARCHEATIRKELRYLSDCGQERWILDMTMSSLFSLLAEWGMCFNQLRVFCDASKALETDQSIFNVMIARPRREFVMVRGERVPLTFNLAGPIQLVESTSNPGIQIADVVAAAFAYVCQHQRDSVSAKWKAYFDKGLCGGSVVPDMDIIDLETPDAIRNSLVLMELVDRSKKGVPLLDGIEQYVFMADQLVRRKIKRRSGSSGLIFP